MRQVGPDLAQHLETLLQQHMEEVIEMHQAVVKNRQRLGKPGTVKGFGGRSKMMKVGQKMGTAWNLDEMQNITLFSPPGL